MKKLFIFALIVSVFGCSGCYRWWHGRGWRGGGERGHWEEHR